MGFSYLFISLRAKNAKLPVIKPVKLSPASVSAFATKKDPSAFVGFFPFEINRHLVGFDSFNRHCLIASAKKSHMVRIVNANLNVHRFCR